MRSIAAPLELTVRLAPYSEAVELLIVLRLQCETGLVANDSILKFT
ncbi:hypothetical protein Cenrod_2166 [Candidatus Symbiobacter mobilis CR]|uniref:Uncharacterized protein n=1 Tax=Candidatus Symbiobacter mobilis CR TaxID=946483 RepID=U5NA88_9BURK|nr:hypothetical protein Cenrod_2166 [Candidatus Symbiobacter mobilis CR]